MEHRLERDIGAPLMECALAALRHELPVFSAGEVVYPAHAREDAVIVFCRADKRERVCAAVNMTNEPQTVRLPLRFGETLLSRGAAAEADCVKMEPYGIFIARCEA